MFKIFTQFAHESCLILVSQELPLELVNLAEENPYYSSLLLTGLSESAKEILQEKQLLDEEEWDYLINLYQGNAYYLKIIARVIKEYFLGSVKNFLASNQQPFLDDAIKTNLQQQINRLTNTETEILRILTLANKSVSFGELQSSLEIPDLLNNIQSLQRRSFVKRMQINENQIVFEISPVLREFLLNLSQINLS